jgi:hypothetical protein
MPPPLSLPNFVRLNDYVFLHQPALARPAKDASPDLILLLSWGNAILRNVAKYTASYHTLYPHSPILVVRTQFADIFTRNQAIQDEEMASAIAVLRSLPKGAGVLVHSFSNGGMYRFCSLSRMYGGPIPVKAWVIDSAPGKARLLRSVKAVAYSLPEEWYLRWSIGLIVLVSLFLVRTWYTLTGGMGPTDKMRGFANAEGAVDLTAKRCYIYSKEDELVEPGDVLEHARDAKAKGVDVRVEEFVGTKHVAHVRGHEKRYWGLVREVWGS